MREAVNLYRSGMGVRKTAEQIGRSYEFVYQAVKRAGVLRSRREAMRLSRGRDMQLTLALEVASEGGVMVSEVAREFGVSEGGIRNRARAEGVRLPGRSDANRLRFLDREQWVRDSSKARQAIRFLYLDGMEPSRIALAWRVGLNVVESILRREAA